MIRMKGIAINQYISDFICLAEDAQYDLNLFPDLIRDGQTRALNVASHVASQVASCVASDFEANVKPLLALTVPHMRWLQMRLREVSNALSQYL